MTKIKLKVAQQIERIAIATQNPMAVWDEVKIKAAFVKAFKKLGLSYEREFVFTKSYVPAMGTAWGTAWDAARDAAWDAAWDAARDAAWGTAGDAAWDAAWDAARDAAWDAARGTAWGTAWGAAWDAALNNAGGHNKESKAVLGLAQELTELGVGMYFIFKDMIIVALCPRMYLDNAGRAHKTDGHAIGWPDGTGYYFIHGIRFEKELFDKFSSGAITALEIITHKNQDQKRAMVMVYGNERMVTELSAKVVAEQIDDKGHIMRLLLIKDSVEDLVFYEAIDPAKNEKIYLRVPEEFKNKTPMEAKIWTFKPLWEEYQKTGILPQFTVEE